MVVSFINIPATTSDGSSLDLVGFDTLGDNATVFLADGSTVPFSQVAVANPSMAAIYEVAKTFQGVGEANAFIQIYQKSGLGAADFIDLYAKIYRESIATKNSTATDAQDTGAGAQGMGTDGVPGMNAATQESGLAGKTQLPFGPQDMAALGMPNLENLYLTSINEKLQEAGLAPLTVDMDLYQEAPDTLNPDDSLAQTDGSGIIIEAQGTQDGNGNGIDDPSNTSHQIAEGAGDLISVPKTRVGQWMSKAEYEQFVKTGEIPRANALTNGMEGYIKQANRGDYYVEFDIDSSLLVPKNEALGWSLIKPKNQMFIKLYQNKGLTLPDPTGTNITHVYTK